MVYRNDEISFEQVAQFDKIILSPGPGIPAEAGKLIPTIKAFASLKPILGVCLGQQALAEAFGGSLRNLPKVYHGVATDIEILAHENSSLFKNIDSPMRVGRYHSWVIDPLSLPSVFRISATDAAGHIMAIEHKTLPIAGVQFHPESVLTPWGEKLLENWLTSV